MHSRCFASGVSDVVISAASFVDVHPGVTRRRQERTATAEWAFLRQHLRRQAALDQEEAGPHAEASLAAAESGAFVTQPLETQLPFAFIGHPRRPKNSRERVFSGYQRVHYSLRSGRRDDVEVRETQIRPPLSYYQ